HGAEPLRVHVVVRLGELLLQEVVLVLGRAVELVRGVDAVHAVLAVPVVPVAALEVRLLHAVVLHQELRGVVGRHGLPVREHLLAQPVRPSGLALLQLAPLLPGQLVVRLPLALLALAATVLLLLARRARTGPGFIGVLGDQLVLVANAVTRSLAGRRCDAPRGTSGGRRTSGCLLLARRRSAPNNGEARVQHFHFAHDTIPTHGECVPVLRRGRRARADM
ncbi:unnamed protein product, partial [Ixodes pacificus]